MANNTNAQFELFKLKTGMKNETVQKQVFVDNRKTIINRPSVFCGSPNPYGFNNSILCSSEFQLNNFLNRNAGCYSMPSIWDAAASSCCTSSCSSSNSDIDFGDMVKASFLNNPQMLQTAGNLIVGALSQLAGFFGFGCDEQKQEGVQVGGTALEAGTKGIFKTSDGKCIEGTLNQDGTVTAANGQKYQAESYVGQRADDTPAPTSKSQETSSSSPAPTNDADTSVNKETKTTAKTATTAKTTTNANAVSANDADINRADALMRRYKDAKDYSEKENILKEFKGQIDNLNAQRGAAESSLKGVEGDISRVDAQLEEIEQKAEAEFKNAKETYEQQKATVNGAKDTVRTKANEESKAKGALAQRTDECDDARAAHKKASQKVADIKEQLKNDPNNSELQAQLKTAESEETAAKRREEIADKARQLANREYEEAQKAHSEAKEKLEKEEQTLKTKERRFKEAQDKLGAKNPEYKTMMEEKNRLEQEKTAYQEKIDNYDLKINELTGFKEQAESELGLDEKGNLTGYKSSLSQSKGS